jgi:hypothetical protein
MLTRPPWVEFDDDQARRQIRYVWDDARAFLDFRGDSVPVSMASLKMSLRARLGLCVGLYEWIVWRFARMHTRQEPVQILEAAWCATVEPRYLRFFELSRSQWLGPVEGPLWCAAAWLQPAMSQGYLFPRKVYDAVSFLTLLCLHVLPDTRRFNAWLEIILARLVQVYPDRSEDPFIDLFNRDVARRLGSLIGRNTLDPAISLDQMVTRQFLADMLSVAHQMKNPFLADPDDLADAGFVGQPYIIPSGL